MLSIIKLELKKFLKDRKNIAIIFIFIAIIFIFVFKNISCEEDRKLRVMPIIGEQLEVISRNMDLLSQDPEPDEKAIDYLNKQLELGKKIRRYASSMTKNEYTLKSKTPMYLQTMISIDKLYIEMINNGYIFKYMKDIKYYKADLEQNTALLQQNIQVIDEGCSMEGFNFLRLCLNNIILMIILGVILFISTESYSSEIQYKTYKLLYTQPLNKNKIFFGKLISKIIISLVVVSAILTICTVILGITRGFGNFKYPIQMIVQGEIKIVPLSNYLVRQFILFFFILVFLCVLGTCISMFSKTISGAMSSGIIISGLLYMISNAEGLYKLKKFIPFSYFNVFEVLSSRKIVEGSYQYLESTLSYNTGIVINIVWAIAISLIFSLIIINSRKMKKIVN